MTLKQHKAIKSSVIDSNDHLNGIFSSFNSLNKEFHPGYHLIDSFSDQFSFYKADCSSIDSKKYHYKCLDKIVFNILSNPNSVIIVSDASIKNNITTSISHVYSFSGLLKKTIHHAINVTSTEAKLFAIRCSIN